MLFLRLNHNLLESLATSLLSNLYLELDTSRFAGVHSFNFLLPRFQFLLNFPTFRVKTAKVIIKTNTNHAVPLSLVYTCEMSISTDIGVNVTWEKTEEHQLFIFLILTDVGHTTVNQV